MIFLFLIFLVMVLGLIPRDPFMRAGRLHQRQWTRYDKDGVPVCGVGYRGYWTNHVIVGGDWKLKQRADGTRYNPETGEDYESISLDELMDRERTK